MFSFHFELKSVSSLLFFFFFLFHFVSNMVKFIVQSIGVHPSRPQEQWLRIVLFPGEGSNPLAVKRRQDHRPGARQSSQRGLANKTHRLPPQLDMFRLEAFSNRYESFVHRISHDPRNCQPHLEGVYECPLVSDQPLLGSPLYVFIQNLS